MDTEPFCDFFDWLCKGGTKRFGEFDQDQDGCMNIRELHTAVTRYLGLPALTDLDLIELYPDLKAPKFNGIDPYALHLQNGRPVDPPPSDMDAGQLAQDIMRLADGHNRNRFITKNEMNNFLRKTEFDYFRVWMLEGRKKPIES